MTATTTAPNLTHPDTAATGKWIVRYTWRVPDDTQHPGHTETRHPSETAAIDAAVTTLDNQAPTGPRIVRAEISGPGRDRYTVDWRP